MLLQATPPPSLTPDSATESDEYQLADDHEQPLTPIPTKNEKEMTSIKQEITLPSPPEDRNSPTNIATTATVTTKLANCGAVLTIESDSASTADLQAIHAAVETGSKWCERCGTIETPRWRYGPSGQSTLCNACHLRWKMLGKPADGYSCSVFPPPFFKPSTLKRKSNDKQSPKAKKLKKADHKKGKKQNHAQTRVEYAPSPLPPPPQLILTSVEPVVIPGICIICKCTETPLWRKGPLGNKTLCNACGLRWSKTQQSTGSDQKPYRESKKPSKKETAEVDTATELTATTTIVKKKQKPPHSSLLHQKKEYIKHGLYAPETRETAKVKIPFTFPLPIHQGEFLITKQTDFELPSDIHQERDLGMIKGLFVNRKPFFTRIRSNLFVERKPQNLSEEQTVCHCVPPTDKEQEGCGDDCINRMLFYECDPKRCPCGSQCSNQRFQRKERTKQLQVFQTGTRGWGLRTLVDINKDDLVIEYRGEVISHELCEERMCTVYVNEKNFYFLDYCNGEVIDACTKGTEARFINHSCAPNCHIEKWNLKGESHFGVFASKDIKAKSELFYDYNFSTFNDSVESQQACFCGSKLCRGTIGKKASNRK